ncbi:MAG: NAD(P)/FAD-dependent oxidoreductase [Acidimicrobiales bacterium]
MPDQIVVIGGGIAGVSAAAFLAEGGANVTLVERESTLAYHTTGRSAAQWIVNYGHPATRKLAATSRRFFDEPPPGATDGPLLSQRAVLMVSSDPTAEVDDQFASVDGDGPAMEPVEPSTAASLCPLVDPGRTEVALLDSGSMEIDVGALHQAFVRMLRSAGGSVATSIRVDAAEPFGDRWRVDTTTGQLTADIVVNAAGAWGDPVARSAGVEPVGLQPRLRTAFMVPGSSLPDADLHQSHSWPMLIDLAHRWYVKPDGTQFLCSPADQRISPAVDAKPEEVDIAVAIDRINTDTRLEIRSVASKWAGLRTFAPDESLVLGPDPDTPRFVWCVGQGGVGIQTSPAAGRLIADLVLERSPDPSTPLPDLLPDRLRSAG